jgi:hypothetical protein
MVSFVDNLDVFEWCKIKQFKTCPIKKDSNVFLMKGRLVAPYTENLECLLKFLSKLLYPNKLLRIA